MAGLTSPEIAQNLERSPDWVRTTQHRAVLQLHSILQVTPDQGGTGRD
jgi:DNA-directed RNA polymerase specialized sigma24 family protein